VTSDNKNGKIIFIVLDCTSQTWICVYRIYF